MANDPERKLYTPLVDLMRGLGYQVHREFWMLLREADAGRLIDVLGVRWNDDGNLDAWAVEAKKGNSVGAVLSALPQAVEYSVGVPRVSIASEASGGLLSHATQALANLGIGYVEARRGGAREVSEPKPSGLLDRPTFQRTLRHAGALLLFGPELQQRLGASQMRIHSGVDREARPKSARDRSSDELRWGFALHNVEDVQVMLHTGTAQHRVRACAWVQAIGALRDIWTRLTVERLRTALEKTTGGWLVSPRWHEMRRLGPPSEPARVLTAGDKDLEQKLRWAQRLLAKESVHPIIDVSIDLWGYDEAPSRSQAVSALERAVDTLLPVRRELRQLRAEGMLRKRPRSRKAIEMLAAV